MLANEERRQIYDQLGPDGLQQTGDAGFNNYADLNDIFESIFGGDGFSQRPTRTEDMVQRLPLTLDELYTGVKKDFAVTRNKICPDCKGLRYRYLLTRRVGTTKPNAVHRCPRCNGKGFVMQTTVVMGMMAQSRSVCPECGGEGSSINGKDKCKTCHGKKVRREREQMSVTIRPGMDHGQKVILRGAADQDPHLETGDIVFYIDQIEHPVFRRRGSDLFVRRDISLLQSLTGAEVTLDHLNGEKVTLRSEAGDLLPPDCVRCVEDLGMPVYNAEGKFGKLYVQLRVQYPKGLTAKQMEALKQVLGEVEQGKESVEVEKKEEKESVKEEKDDKKDDKDNKKDDKKDDKKDNKKDKKDDKKDAKTESTPKSSVFTMKQCDQTIYGNKKLWDVVFSLLSSRIGIVPVESVSFMVVLKCFFEQTNC